ncbi:3-oxoacyl-[acyl-carrier-protein] reductase [Anaerorhabdus furcosa]|uniref:3-oxoacyl-[acyl-carrier-protein] reductase n=1 Tax=Anaerorhabdus furcosa TaxID=118967 RepID=A0A1T4KPA2_9FIRM|nr:3-oxoacyl-[acyl-carrier-protein] reductase [Anaerorhabdus furcosa]SJZ44167.1 3-oxoacyl-[acyl-carrier-protein] reductase [Anaerorhabdus furcosa]
MTRKVALVTGASRGIGAAIAKCLAADHDVIINFASREEQALQVLNTLPTGNHSIYKCDVQDHEAVKEMMKSLVEKYGRIDVLVNNAGVTRDNLMLKMSDEDFDKVMAINTKGCFNCIQTVSRIMMKQREGKIINIASVIGLIGNIGQVNYAASKGAIIAMTKASAKELGSRNIQVNAIAPGFIETEMTQVLNENLKNKMMDVIPLKRFGHAEEVAGVAKFLASKDADYITGQVIVIDGGMVM